jgi:hypothetical protein
LSSLRKHVKKPSKITFVIAAATVTTAAAVTTGAVAVSASQAAQTGHTAIRVVPAAASQTTGLASAELASYAVTDRLLQIRARFSVEHVRQVAAEAHIAAERRAAAQRAAAGQAAARRAANAAAGQTSAAQTTASSPGSVQPSGSPQQIAVAMLGSFGWSSSQFGCLVSLWGRESGWNIYASNPSSGAYGIPQALPGSKMASAGPDWASNAATQIRWGLGYIQQLYGSPCAAWEHSEAVGWY